MVRFTTKQSGLGYSLAVGALIGIGLAVVFAAGFFFRDIVGLNSAFAAPFQQTEDGYPLLTEVQLLLDQHYLREQPDYMVKQYAAIRGLIGSLGDRYTFFVEPPVAQSESDVLAGTYGGIGVQIRRDETGNFVLYPFPDSPAAAAGILDGDILIEVNSEPVDPNIQQDVLDQMTRGEVKEGSGVELTVRHTDGETLTTFISFDVINVPSVVWRILDQDDSLGYVQILRFTSRTPEELQTALKELRENGMQALVLDLRNNSGGLLHESVEVAGKFLESDAVVLYEQDKDSEQAFRTERDGYEVDVPMTILVNQGTASAAELVAGALQDQERSILIGQGTYGKGTVQQIFRLSDESSLHITSAQWFTPNRNRLEGQGLTPDIIMIPDPNGRDVELGEAVRQLQQQLG